MIKYNYDISIGGKIQSKLENQRKKNDVNFQKQQQQNIVFKMNNEKVKTFKLSALFGMGDSD